MGWLGFTLALFNLRIKSNNDKLKRESAKMPTRRYWLRAPLLGVYALECKGFAEIPASATLVLVNSALGEHFAVVDWDGCEFLVFLEDLVKRGIAFEPVAA